MLVIIAVNKSIREILTLSTSIKIVHIKIKYKLVTQFFSQLLIFFIPLFQVFLIKISSATPIQCIALPVVVDVCVCTSICSVIHQIPCGQSKNLFFNDEQNTA